mgnify:FL=1
MTRHQVESGTRVQTPSCVNRQGRPLFLAGILIFDRLVGTMYQLDNSCCNHCQNSILHCSFTLEYSHQNAS